MIYGRIGSKNFAGIVDGIARFCEVETATALGHRTAAVLRVCCDAQDKQIYDLDVAIYLGDRTKAGCFAAVDPVDEFKEQTSVSMLGRRAGLNTKESVRAKRMGIKYTDYVGFSSDESVLLVNDKAGTKIDILVKLRLRDIYALRLNNITERVANCIVSVDDTLHPKIDSKWSWTRKLICLASLECLLRALGLWNNEVVRDECRNEAVIKLMLGDLLYEGLEGLDEYNMYANDAEQRVKDSELLLTCGKWLAHGGTEVAQGLRAGDVSEKTLDGWKKTLETDLGVVLPPLTKHGELRRVRSRKGEALTT